MELIWSLVNPCFANLLMWIPTGCVRDTILFLAQVVCNTYRNCWTTNCHNLYYRNINEL